MKSPPLPGRAPATSGVMPAAPRLPSGQAECLMGVIPSVEQRGYAHHSTEELRRAFLVTGLFEPRQIVLKYWETDRTIVGGAVPGADPLALPCPRELSAAFFNERRELGVINLGGAGTITVDEKSHELQPHDCLYVGRGSRDVAFASADTRRPAEFYLLSYPAQHDYPTTHARLADTPGVHLGEPRAANVRTIYKFIHPGGIKSCQLVMGLTVLEPGSVWNTMPPHTHLRRSEVYLYFGIATEAALFHFAGRPDETRNLMVRDRQAVLSPPWSVHCGVGTSNYSFIWGMGGENQEFADMDPVVLDQMH